MPITENGDKRILVSASADNPITVTHHTKFDVQVKDDRSQLRLIYTVTIGGFEGEAIITYTRVSDAEWGVPNLFIGGFGATKGMITWREHAHAIEAVLEMNEIVAAYLDEFKTESAAV